MKRKTPLAECERCPLFLRVGMEGRGVLSEGHADIVFVGEGPGREEAVQRKVFVGPSGRMLMSAFDPKRVESYWITNSAVCFAGSNAKEKVLAADCCKERLYAELAALTPKLVVTLGNIPTDMLLGIKKGEKITRRRGRTFSATINNVPTVVLPTFHPAAVLRSSSLGPDFRSDMEQALRIVEGVAQVEVAAPSPYDIPFTLTTDYLPVLREAEEGPYAVLDLETSSLDMTQGRIICAVIATHKGVYVFPEELVERPDFAEAMERSTANWSGHNSKFDRNWFLYRTGRRITFKFDTLLAHYLLDERPGIHSLKKICQRDYGAPPWGDLVRVYTGEIEEEVSYANVPRDQLYIYAANDGYWQYRLTGDLIEKLLENRKWCWLMKNLLMPAVSALSDAETQGILLDRVALTALYPKYEEALKLQEQQMYAIAGAAFNPRSPKQVAHVMYDVLGIPQVGKEGRSTNAKAVLMVYDEEYPFVTSLLTFRELDTVLTRYVKGLDEALGGDGRIHTTYNLSGTVTGRLSAKNPNVQNQPNRNAGVAKDIRDLFMADEGMMWADCDFSQIEYRMIALLSQDPYLIKCYQEGRDMHGEMAAEAWGGDYTKDQRTLAKGVNFGLLYGRSEGGILRDGTLKIPPELVHVLSQAFFAKMGGVVSFNESVKRQVLSQGYVESPLGRRRRFPQLAYAKENRRELETIYREAINMISQSAASDATLYSFVTLHKKGYHPMITVHDSVTMLADERDIEDVVREQMKVMSACATELYGDLIPLPAEGSYGKRWGSLKGVA